MVARAADVDLKLRNRSSQTLAVPRPSPAFILVHAQTGGGLVLPCETAPLPGEIELVELAPGAELDVHVDFASRCALDSASELVLRVQYAVPETVRRQRGARGAWTGATPPVLVQVSPSAPDAAAVPTPGLQEHRP